MQRKTAAERPLGWAARSGYALGDFGFNLYWSSIGLFLYFMYTDVMGITPFVAGISYAIASIWDAVSDPIMGSIADRTRTRWGKFRPYLLIGALPCAVFFALSFWAPPLEGLWLVLYATLTHIGLRTFYTVMNIPYIALSAAMTSDSTERSRLAGARMVFAASGALAVSFLTPVLVEYLGGDQGTSWFVAAAVTAVTATIMLAICFRATREEESNEPHTAPAVATKAALRSLVRDTAYFWGLLRLNTPLARVFGGILLVSVALTMFQKCIMYWVKYGIGDLSVAKWAMPIPAIALIVSAPAWVALARRTSKRAAWIVGAAISCVGYIAFFFNPLPTLGITLALIAIVSIGKAAFSVMFWAMLPDTVEYGAWKLGVRDEAKVFGFAVFAQKAALAINAFLLGHVLESIGFVANTTQSAGTLLGIKAVMSLVPLLGAIAAAAIIWRYPLDAKLHAQILRDLAQRARC